MSDEKAAVKPGLESIVQVRLSRMQKQRFEAAAAKRGQSLSAWLRGLAEDASRQTPRRVREDAPPAPPPTPLFEPVAAAQGFKPDYSPEGDLLNADEAPPEWWKAQREGSPR